jgi:hypothetical protein
LQAIALMLVEFFLGIFSISHYNKWLTTASSETIIARLKTVFSRPWQPPKRSLVEAVNAVTQYGAWVLLHGYAVNHHHTSIYSDLEKTAKDLGDRGIPLKNEIEGKLFEGFLDVQAKNLFLMTELADYPILLG